MLQKIKEFFSSKINQAVGVIGLMIVLVFASFVFKYGCGCHILPPLPNPVTVVQPDPEKPIIVQPGHVHYTPKPTANNPKPTPIIIPKPPEGNVTFEDGKAKIQNLGLCFVPKLGWSTEGWYAGSRVFFWGSFGLELMANDKRGFVGVDYRLPWLNNLTLAAGATFPYQWPILPSVYGGASVCLGLW